MSQLLQKNCHNMATWSVWWPSNEIPEMKLAYLANSLGAGGAERHLLNLARDMVRRGYAVWVVVLKRGIRGGANSLELDFAGAGVKVIYLNSCALGDAGRWFSLIKLLRHLLPDIIHSHLPRSDLAASIAKAALPNMLWVSTLHDTYTRDKYSGHWIFPFIRWNWRRADHVVAVSKHVQEWGVRALALPSHKTSVIYHGVPLSENPNGSQTNMSEQKLIGCLARFEKRKGMETLVKAMVEIRKSFPEAQLLLAGSDPTGYSNVIKRLARSLKVEGNVKVLDFCAAPLGFLYSLDVFAFASVSEGFGIVLIEAMSVKCPVVASNIYPINHIVQHGESGLLVNSEDHHAFADAIIELLGNPARAREMGEAGYQRCIDEFSLEKALNKVHDLYIDLTKRPHAY
ncbi:MAG: glycosyltransferase family 4 protein [Hydrogenophilales bacterium]|nr:glycosyltransferase family 4 protein [Hydrogenophilales bacterium]